ncbi:MAG: hypothetical protein EBX30_11210 [Betaproteobacteria bacterium]|nr:hypothetical protein [Betaproteobacteria bacterium]
MTSVSSLSQASIQGVQAASPRPAADLPNRTESSRAEQQVVAATKAKSTTLVVTDTQSHEVIRQIPAPEVVELGRTIDYLSSLLISQKA